MRHAVALPVLFALAACATPRGGVGPAPVRVKVIGFNDFHGNLEPPRTSVSASVAGQAEPVRVPAGGAAYFASALARLRAANPNNVTVSAGDMIGASPLTSSIVLDEPTVMAMNLMQVDFNAVGNHEFDRGRAELLRMQKGGCEKNTGRTPCALDRFPGARFNILAANVRTESGATLFPAYGIRTFRDGGRQVRVGFIGLTLKGTPTLVTPAGVAGLKFEDEAATINALVPTLRRAGADAIVVMIHQGGAQQGARYATSAADVPPAQGCGSLEGDLLPILAKLDPAVDLVVSGHTHNAYICDYAKVDPARRFLVTSAGRYGTLVTDIELGIAPGRGVVSRQARNLIVQGEGYGSGSGAVALSDRFPVYPRDPVVAALVGRYAAAAAPLAARVVGELSGPATRDKSPAGESPAGDLIADAQLAATRDPKNGGAQIAFMNGYGVRADIRPTGGKVTFGDIYAAQPFGNSLMVRTFTGAQIRRLLEQQFASGANTVDKPNMLMPSRGLTYAYDLRKPEGQRILDLELDGRPIEDARSYRVTISNFLATGGDNFTVFAEGADTVGAGQDLDALEAYFAAAGRLDPPAPDRIRRLDASVGK